MRKIKAILTISSFLFTFCSCKETQEINNPSNLQETCDHSFIKDESKKDDCLSPTCLEPGYEWEVCAKCGYSYKKGLKALKHDFSVIKSTTATCNEGGWNIMACSRCGAESYEVQEVPALGHDWVVDPTYEGMESWCEDPGVGRKKCSRCGDYLLYDTPSLGHDYQDNVILEQSGYPTLNSSRCERTNCSSKIIYWNAIDVNENCKTQRMVNGKNEPNYVVCDTKNGGVTFYGRAIHNAQNLRTSNASVDINDSYYDSIYDSSIEGSFLEYTINLPNDFDFARLVVEMKPSEEMDENEDVFDVSSNDATPGLIDSINNKCGYERQGKGI